MNKFLKSLAILSIFVVSCNNNKQETMKNPLLESFNTPFGVPPFDKIKAEHYEPAIDSAIQLAKLEIDSIVKNSDVPTFENTIEALAYSGIKLNDIAAIFFNLNESNTNDTLQEIATRVSPKISGFTDEIFMNSDLFKKVQAVYQKKDSLKLNEEQVTLLENTYRNFIRSGVNLALDQKERLKKINSELSVLTLKFGQNVLAENNKYKLIIDKKEGLAGLPQNIIDAAADCAKENKLQGKWVFTLQNPSVMGFLQYSSNRELRKTIQQAYINRGNNNDTLDNKKIIVDILKLRIEKAKLLGYKNYAEYILVENMAKTPERVSALLDKLWKATLPVAKKESGELQQIIDKEGGKFKLQAWDWRYYAEKLRKQKYDLDEDQVKPYFELENVRKGIFEVANKLYGLSFKKLENTPTYYPEASAYEVLDSAGNHQGVLYLDMHPRASKKGGAWMTTYRSEYKLKGKKITPVVSIVCNFTKPTGSDPALLTFDEVSTFFHEFGHGLNYLLHDITYPGLPVPPDFVELPSQIMENWAVEPEVLNSYAKHYKTGEVIPAELVNKIVKSGHFNQGFATSEYLAASYLDMNFHTLTEIPDNFDVLTFEKNSLDKLGLIPEITSRYRSTYYLHIFNLGYWAGYYGYIWAEMLDADAFEAFKEKGIFDKQTAKLFRDNVLAKSGAGDLLKLYIQFRGKEPVIEPLLNRRGLN
jgi:peptidyl-dipeptidase Dcp